MAPWHSPRRALFVVVLLLLCFHIALSSSPASPSPKTKAPGRKALLPPAKEDAKSPSPKTKTPGRKALLAPAKEDAKPAKIAAAAAAVKAKKKPVSEAKNQTKVLKPKKSNSTTTTTTTKAAAAKAAASITAKVKLQKLNKTAAAKPKASDSTKPAKPTKAATAKPAKSEAVGATTKKPSHSSTPTAAAIEKPTKSTKKMQEAGEPKPEKEPGKPGAPDVAFADEAEGTEDLISEFRGLPARLQETLMPDLARLSSTSKAYLSAANAGIAEGVRPLLGSRWAAVAASAASVAALLLPLCLLTALVQRMGPYLPLLHRALLFSQAYLAIYFATLALAAAATGLEPLRFFHAASPAAYAWTQAAQSLGYVAYLVLQMVDLVAVFSANGGAGEGAKALGLAQMVVGLAVGLHYYAAVFHRAAAGEAPRANWRVHAVYAACFVVVCACARAERRKKAYLAGGDAGAEDCKKS